MATEKRRLQYIKKRLKKSQINCGVDGGLEELEGGDGLDGCGERVEHACEKGDEATGPVVAFLIAAGTGQHKEKRGGSGAV